MNTDPSWSPDGAEDRLHHSDRDRNTNIYMMDRDGKNQKRLTDDPGEDVTYWAIIEVAADAPTGEVQAVRLWPDGMVAILPGRREF